ncbi:MAG: cation-transporting P-type ATPase [Rhodospirillales bacterium]|nr:MAG: cation-transporting P-type ATPase [Rhodospirillales bacterium]
MNLMDALRQGPEPAGSAGEAAGDRRDAANRPPSSGAVIPLHAVVAGRVRLRVPSLRGDPALQEALPARIRRLGGVRDVEASRWSGSVLVSFDPGLPVDAVIRAVADAVEEGTPNHATDAAGPRSNPSPQQGDARPAARPSRRRGAANEPATAGEPPLPWHRFDVDEVARRLECCASRGLSSAEADRRLARFGPNALDKASHRSTLAMLWEQVASLPVAMLAASAVLSAATGGVVDAVVIMGVVAINAAIGYVTEVKSEETIAALGETAPTVVTVLRDGQAQGVPMEDVVPGDLQVLEAGSFIAADARVIAADDLTVDESSLTGESMSVTKTVARPEGDVVPLGDRTNMVFRGTVPTGGSGRALVVATGKETEIGRIQAMIGTAATPETPMQVQLDRMGGQLAWISTGICAVVFVLGLARGQGVLPMLKSAASLAVAAVPEGLPTIATTTLAIGIGKMRRHNVLVRRLDAVETLGAVQVVCFDKTGTLTLNRMSVVSIVCGGRRYRLSDGTLTEAGERVDPADSAELQKLGSVAALCNEAEIKDDQGAIELQGSGTETALVRMAMEFGIDVAALRRSAPGSTTNHRTESRQFMGTTHEVNGDGPLFCVKGNPSAVLEMCRWQLIGGDREAMTDADRQRIEAANERMGGEALRVLGFAFAENAADREDGEPELTWLGLVGMADPVRPGMADLMDSFHKAGIGTVMITGDQSATAYAVARQLRLGRGQQIEILDSTHMEKLEPEVLASLAKRAHVFARVSPGHKLQIVQALQQGGKVVAMTGDGVNDSPALKAANIGLAMGQSGTDVAREVADVVLKDDNPETIIVAISHGRTLYHNVRNALRFLLATNLSEILVMLGTTALGLRQTLTPMQLLWINLLTDVFPALALAMEPPDGDVMAEKPRDPGEAILRAGDLKRAAREGAVISAAALGAAAYGHVRYGPDARAGAVTFLSLITAQLLHAITCRSDRHGLFRAGRLPRNPAMTAALGGSLAVQGATLAVPRLRRLLGLQALGMTDAAVIGAAAVLPFVINEALKPAPPPHDERAAQP